MVKRLLKTFMAVLAIAAAAAGPVRGQNSTTYNVTFSGFSYPALNTTVNVASLPQTFTSNFNPPSVINDVCYGFTGAYVTSGGEGEVSASVVTFTEMSITVNGTFEGTATIHVTGKDDEERDISTDVYVSCVAVAPAAPTPHTVRLAEGTEDAANWTVTPAEALTTGIIAGSPLTATYVGDLKVKEVIATKHYEPTPLTIEALTAGTVVVQQPKSGMQYTLNGGPKTAMTEAPTEITVAVGDKVAFYGNGTSITSYNGTGITGGTAEVKAYGNIMSLVNEMGFDTATTLPANSAFYYLFEGYANLKDISGLKLPATTLTGRCYMAMFTYCTGLTTVPSDLLPATTLARSCYARMFMGCENLTNVPTLPATTLAVGCYENMFFACKGLTTVSTDLLPATTLAEGCYSFMFFFCQNLTTAPVLPATTLVDNCYSRMFANCSNLSSVTCLATSGIDQNHSTDSWLSAAGDAVQGTKIFTAASSATWPMDNYNGIPIGWTVVYVPNN